MTSNLRSLFLENYEYSLFDFTDPNCIAIKVASSQVIGRLIAGHSTPLDLIEEYTEYSGRMEPLPDWVMKGAVAGIQGGEEVVSEIIRHTLEAGVPLAAVWLQDWW
jgi:sulfoquinovosidase